ncbi:MAG: apolipoprotein N-acyltransferase [Actinomycetes bacterium]
MLTRWWTRILAAAVSGAVLSASFAPLGWWPAAVIGVLLLTLACWRASAWQGLACGGVSGFIFFALLMPWLRVIGDEAWIGLSLYCAAWIALVGLGTSAVTRLRWWPVLVPLVWVLEEALRDRVPWGGFPWGRLAYSQADAPYAAISRIGGMPLLTFWVAALAALLLAALLHVRRHRRLSVLALLTLLVLVVIGRGLAWYSPLPHGSAVVAVVQGGTPQMGMGAMDVRRQVLDNHVSQTLRLAADISAGKVAQPQLVIWPENSSDLDPFSDATASTEIQRAADAVHAPILVGAVAEVPGQPQSLWNLGIVWNPGTGPAQRYAKTHLVPFGEFIPMRDLIGTWFADFQRISRDFVPGTKPGVMEAGGIRIGDIICFEVAYDDIPRDVLNAGAQLLVVQTNNATYGATSQPDQQLAIERLRALESAADLAVAATTGITALIDSSGSPVQHMDSGKTGYLVGDVSLSEARTWSTVLGAWPEALLSAIAVITLTWATVAAVTRRRARRT